MQDAKVNYYLAWFIVWIMSFVALLTGGAITWYAYPYVAAFLGWALDTNEAQAALIVWCIFGYYVWLDAVRYMVRKYESYPGKFRPVVALSGGAIALAILLISGPFFLARRWYYEVRYA